MGTAKHVGTSLEVQWLRLRTFVASSMGSIPAPCTLRPCTLLHCVPALQPAHQRVTLETGWGEGREEEQYRGKGFKGTNY